MHRSILAVSHRPCAMLHAATALIRMQVTAIHHPVNILIEVLRITSFHHPDGVQLALSSTGQIASIAPFLRTYCPSIVYGVFILFTSCYKSQRNQDHTYAISYHFCI
jgi:hypothetical protein